MLERVLDTHAAAATVMHRLPPNPEYTVDYQPRYHDGEALFGAVHELHNTQAVTNPTQILSLKDRLAAIAKGESSEFIVEEGRCAEPIDANIAIGTMVSWRLSGMAVVNFAINGPTLYIGRYAGQAAKPRSSAVEVLPDGTEVPPYMGDAVNGQGITDRTPDPSRMVAMAVQSRDVVSGLTEAIGFHVPTAHEALLLPYEESFKYTDESGKTFLLSADKPWIGKRTNGVNSRHVELLEGTENPIDVKIGADSTPEHIRELKERLNPNDDPGRLTFMLRTGPNHTTELAEIAHAIAEYAPNSLTMYDIHGTTRTRTEDGKTHKIRAVPEIIDDVAMTSDVLGQAGLRLHGVHIETTPDHSRLECVDDSDELPQHPGGVDPQLNPRQEYAVLDGIARRVLAGRV